MPEFTHVMMSSEALEAALQPPKMSFIWCMVCSTDTKTSPSEKGEGVTSRPGGGHRSVSQLIELVLILLLGIWNR